jgi:hypothetical protein
MWPASAVPARHAVSLRRTGDVVDAESDSGVAVPALLFSVEKERVLGVGNPVQDEGEGFCRTRGERRD